jgi:hypothetical protein
MYSAIRTDGEQTRRHMDVVAESLHAEIRLLAEALASLDRRVMKLEGTRRER